MASDIQNFYRNKTIFVTGGTGFVGMVAIEKLLRATEVKRIYMLVRSKREKSAEERLASLFKSPLFEKLRAPCDQPFERIKPILGDCNLDNIGLSTESRKIIVDEVNVIIHCAATIRFNDTLYKATSINVRATLDLIKLAKEMKHLEAFVHVSSAFANCMVHSIEEKYYNENLAITAVKMCELCDTLGFETTNRLEGALCNEYQNTYTFSKSLAEEAILSEGRSLPISIFRPALVTQTYHEPLSGWIGNLHGPSAAFYAQALGIIRVLYLNARNYPHLVPADYCANLILAIGWETAKKSQQERTIPPIYNFANDNENPLSWQQYIDDSYACIYDVALSKMIWYPFTITTSRKWLYLILSFFLHTIPGYLLDFLLVLKGKKKRLTEVYNKIYKQTNAAEYFLFNNFHFTMDNTKALWNSLSAGDKEMFNFDIFSIYWTDYLQSTLTGLRIHMCGDTPDTLPYAKKKYKMLQRLHQTTKVVLYGIFILLLWTCLKIIIF